MGHAARTHLFVVHVGPVQEFIASARRTRDLWFGSWLLSELAKAAALEIVEQNGDDVSCLIFPAPESKDELRSPGFSAPNKVVACIRQDPADLGARVQDAVLERLREMWVATFGPDGQRSVSGDVNWSVAWDQVEDFPEVYWVAWPTEVGAGGGQDKAARDAAEALLHARKQTRDFRPVTWGNTSAKCSLDGLRESVIPQNRVDGSSERDLRKRYGTRRGEHLCGVCLLKRHGERRKQDHFLSTSHVAILPLLQRLEDKHKPSIERYVQTLLDCGVEREDLETVRPPHPVLGEIDGQLLFEDRLREVIEGNVADRDKVPERLEKARKALRELIDDVFDRHEPSPYYALLCADGDRMGEMIDAQESAEMHRRLSYAQSRFASEARRVVGDYQGSFVYSGGDDVLAFVPLHTVLECARRLAETFKQQLSRQNITPTLSVGIAIVHHLSPLSDSLELARGALGAAKHLAGRNALAVTLSKRGGPDRMVYGPWGELDQRLEWFAELHVQDAIPDGAAFELLDLALRLKDIEERADPETSLDELRDILSAEARRILSRKRARHGAEPIAQATLLRLIEYIENGLKETARPCEHVIGLADEVVVARVLASAMVSAGVPSRVRP